MESTGTKAILDTHLLVWSQSVKFQSNPSSSFGEVNCVNSFYNFLKPVQILTAWTSLLHTYSHMSSSKFHRTRFYIHHEVKICGID